MRNTLMIGALATLALVAPAQATMQSGADFMARIKEAAASSAVPPLRQRGVEAHVLPGHFDGKRADAVVIIENSASWCKGPDYKRCLPIGQLPAARTVAVNMANGKSVLLQIDSLSLGQVCTVDAHGGRASLDCRALDFNKLADYRAKIVGKVLMVDAVDGQYFCSETRKGTSCVLILAAGATTVDRRTVRQQTKDGLKFVPTDQPGKECRVKRSGDVVCGDRLKQRSEHRLSGDLQPPFAPVARMLPVLTIIGEEDLGDGGGGFGDFGGGYDYGGGGGSGWDGGSYGGGGGDYGGGGYGGGGYGGGWDGGYGGGGYGGGGNPAFETWEIHTLDTIEISARWDYGNGYFGADYMDFNWFYWNVGATEPQPQRNAQCQADCADADRKFENTCRFAAAVSLLSTPAPRNVVVSAAVYAACQGVRALKDEACNSACYF